MPLLEILFPLDWQHHLLAIAALGHRHTDILWALGGIVLALGRRV